MMRTESELTMRNLRNLNQELQAQVKEVQNVRYLPLNRDKVTVCYWVYFFLGVFS